jgi:hypothetical protein
MPKYNNQSRNTFYGKGTTKRYDSYRPYGRKTGTTMYQKKAYGNKRYAKRTSGSSRGPKTVDEVYVKDTIRQQVPLQSRDNHSYTGAKIAPSFNPEAPVWITGLSVSYSLPPLCGDTTYYDAILASVRTGDEGTPYSEDIVYPPHTRLRPEVKVIKRHTFRATEERYHIRKWYPINKWWYVHEGREYVVYLVPHHNSEVSLDSVVIDNVLDIHTYIKKKQ